MSSRSNVASVGACKRQGSEVDLDVPLRQQAIVRLEGCERLLGDDDASLASASRQALPEFARRHAASLQPVRRQAADERASTATAAGVTPGIRSAWPSVSGRTCVSR